MKGRLMLLLIGCCVGATQLFAVAQAAAAPTWNLSAQSNSSVAPGGSVVFRMQLETIGAGETSGPIAASVSLPAGLKATSVEPEKRRGVTVGYSWNCSVLPAANVTCTDSVDSFGRLGTASATYFVVLKITASVNAALAPGTVKTASFQVSGGGSPSRSTVAPITVDPAPPVFGLSAFDQEIRADPEGDLVSRAAAHPYDIFTSFDLNAKSEPTPYAGDVWPVEPLRDTVVKLAPGLVGNVGDLPRCPRVDLSNSIGYAAHPLCRPETQVGTIDLRVNGKGGGYGSDLQYGYPLYNVQPSPGVPASFGFQVLGVTVVLDAHLRSGSDYGLTVSSRYISEALPVVGAGVDFWGVPAAEGHDAERACPDSEPPVSGGPSCDSPAEETAFLRTATSCQAQPGSPDPSGFTTTIHADSWVAPGATGADGEPDLSDPAWKNRESVSHQLPGYPYPPGEWGPPMLPEHCEDVPFDPGFVLQPTSESADSPTGLTAILSMPQQGLEEPGAIAESDLRDARVVLPAGMSVNPAAADGLGACTSAQLAIHSSLPAHCPDSAKIGQVEIETPLLDHTLGGGVYLAAQQDNPFDSLLGMYIVVDDEASGVVLKLPGQVVADPATGRLETTFSDQPQLPFARLRLELFTGPRAALRTPPKCGAYASAATLTPWSGTAPVNAQSSFQITQGCGGGFDPKLSAGTEDPLAGTTSPFGLRLSREDGSQELGSLELTLPPGLSGYLKGIPYCPDAILTAISGELGTGKAQETSPSCPPASQVGSVTAGAGAGPNPFYTQSGRVYLAGPYKGAPLSLAVVAPAVAGPFDLGSVVVRNALRVDPQTAQITAVSDPLPAILHGIPLDLRDVRVQLSRQHFTLNPTSCEAMQISSQISSTQGATASPSVRFQVAGCERLAFKPRLSLRLSGATGRSGHPALKAVFRPKLGNANASRIQVALPHSEFLAQSHIRTICTRVQFAADQCPAGSAYGRVTATTPILDQPLTGDVYLRSSDNPLPDMVLKLRGPASQPIEIDAVGRIDSHKGGIRTTFQTVPDAPLTKVVLSLPAGRKSLLENSTDVCRGKHKAAVQMDAHNGRSADSSVPLVARCAKKKQGRHRR